MTISYDQGWGWRCGWPKSKISPTLCRGERPHKNCSGEGDGDDGDDGNDGDDGDGGWIFYLQTLLENGETYIEGKDRNGQTVSLQWK